MNPKILASLPRYISPIAVLLVLYLGLRAHYFDNVPIYDNLFFYRKFVLEAQARPFDFLNYSGNHNAELWMLLAGIPNIFFPENFYAYNVWVAILGTIGVYAFYLIVKELARGALTEMECCLVTALFAFHPSILSSQVHITLDTGLQLFWVWYLLAVLKGQRIWAILMGCGLLFSKETALAHLPIVFIFCTLLRPPAERAQWAKKNVWVAMVPLIAMVLFLDYKIEFRGEMLFYRGFLQAKDPVIHVGFDMTLINYILMALVLNFNWLLMIVGIVLTLLPGRRRHPPYKKQLLAYGWLFFCTFFIVVVVRHYSNVRYLQLLFPVMILYIAHFLPLIPLRQVRLAILVILLALLGLENFRTIDPVSKKVFCTTRFGTHTVLFIPGTTLCIGADHHEESMAKDQLVYNLEFTRFTSLVFKMIADTHPTSETAFIMSEGHVLYFFRDGFDAHFQPTFASDAPIYPRFLRISPTLVYNSHYAYSLPQEMYYIEFPFMNNPMYREFLGAFYTKLAEKTYDMDGYQTTLVHYVKKANPQK